jgi:hypothetical protein
MSCLCPFRLIHALGPEILGPLADWLQLLIAASGAVLGLIVCFLGARTLKLCLFVLGFGVGAVCGGVITWKLTLEDDKSLIAAACAGAVVGALCLCVGKVGKLVAGASLGFFPVFLFIQAGGASALGGNVLAWSLLCVGVVAAALFAYFMRHYVFMVATSYGGALAMVVGLAAFLPGDSHVDPITLINDPSSARCGEWQCYAVIVAWVVFGTMGLVAQALTHYIFHGPDPAQKAQDVRLIVFSSARCSLFTAVHSRFC